MTGQLSPLAQGKAAGAAAPYGSLMLKTGQTIQYDSELDDGYYEKGVAKSYTVNTAGSQSGTTNVDLTHLVSDTGAFTAVDKTYTDAGKCGVFKAAGGETVVISGSGNNNGVFTTASATANTVVFVEAITDEADAPLTTFKKREAVSNNTVLDNNTGLTWLRNESSKMGIAGDGKIPYTGVSYDIYQWCAACNAAGVGGYTDWRIPNYYEITPLVYFNRAYSASAVFDKTAFPSILMLIWTSTTINADITYGIYLDQYGLGSILTKTSALYCMLVRGG